MNFVSAARASSAISDRGFVSVPMELNWGEDGKVFTIESADFQKRSMEILGYAYDAPELKPLRDLFLNARTAYLYRLNSGEKAENAYGTAKYTGTRGNDIRIVIQANVDEPEKFDVITYLGASKVDSQTVGEAAELEENSFVRFKKDIQLEATAGAPMSGGVNKEEITGDDHQAALVKLEAYTCNILICTATDEKMKKLYAAFTKRLRDETGVKFQTVIYGYAGDYPGVINLKNAVTEEGTKGNELVFWLGGAEAACAANKTLTNRNYDGEYMVAAEYTQTELVKALQAGELCFHKVGNEIHVLDDINSFVTFTDEMSRDFSMNQVVRVLDQYGNDIALLFNSKYLGKIPNDKDGRVSFWGDLDDYNKKMQSLRAVTNYNPEELTVEQGEERTAVVVRNPVQVVCAMAKCYMTVYVN